MLNKRKKVTKYRGSHTHGGGSKKKRRGAGHRGGRGNAGSGKRADTKKPSVWKTSQVGRGFYSLKEKDVIINLHTIEHSVETLLAKKKAELRDGVYFIDLTTLGFTKLLSKGKVSRMYELRIGLATEQARIKVEAAKGKVISPVIKEEE